MFTSPCSGAGAATFASPSQSRASRATAHLQVVLARQRLATAEAALRAAIEIEEGTDASPRAQFQIGVAARVRTVLLARDEARMRHYLHEWRNGVDAVAIVNSANEAIEAAAAATTSGAPHPPASGGLFEAVLARLEPAALQWALGEWSRACADMGRAASASSLRAASLEGKWAMQRAAALDAAHREQVVKGVLRHWQQTDLIRGWVRWQKAAALMQVPAPLMA